MPVNFNTFNPQTRCHSHGITFLPIPNPNRVRHPFTTLLAYFQPNIKCNNGLSLVFAKTCKIVAEISDVSSWRYAVVLWMFSIDKAHLDLEMMLSTSCMPSGDLRKKLILDNEKLWKSAVCISYSSRDYLLINFKRTGTCKWHQGFTKNINFRSIPLIYVFFRLQIICFKFVEIQIKSFIYKLDNYQLWYQIT